CGGSSSILVYSCHAIAYITPDREALMRLGISLTAMACGLALMTGAAHAEIACEPEKAAEKYPDSSQRVVQIAASPTTPPFTYSDPENLDKLTGIEIEMVEFAMECAGLKYEFVKGPFST